MQILTTQEAMQQLAKAIGKPCMFIGGWDGDDFADIIKAAPYLDFKQNSQAILDGCAILIFDSLDEMEHYYALTVGDDGPTLLNSYNGNTHVYALTCSSDGKFLNENT